MKKFMEKLILQFITDSFGDYKTALQNNHLILYHDDFYVVGALIYERKQFNYMQHVQHAIMDMFSLTIDEVNWYMKRWVASNLNEDVLNTDGVFGHQ
jgi:RNase P/RNase MRP subunit POP5